MSNICFIRADTALPCPYEAVVAFFGRQECRPYKCPHCLENLHQSDFDLNHPNEV